jgi:hypothetical protein
MIAAILRTCRPCGFTCEEDFFKLKGGYRSRICIGCAREHRCAKGWLRRAVRTGHVCGIPEEYHLLALNEAVRLLRRRDP